MAWGTFSAAHIVSLICAAIIGFAIYFLLKNRSEKVQLTVLGILSFAGIFNFSCNLLLWGAPLENLPLHLCNLNAVILPYAVFKKNTVLSNLTLLWALGAAIALILNQEMAGETVLGFKFCIYYFSHLLEIVVPVLLFKFGLCRLEPKCIYSTLGITIAAYTAIYFINCGINNWAAANAILDSKGAPLVVNYMYSVIPNNPVLELFHRIIPYSYWYMYVGFLIVIPYLGAIYGVDYLLRKHKNK